MKMINDHTFLYTEANIYSPTSLEEQIRSLAEVKMVNDNRIIDWLIKAEKRFIQNPSNDQNNIRSGYIKKHEAAPGEPAWTQNTFDAVSIPSERVEFLNHVIDYFNAKSDDPGFLDKLYKKTYDQVYNVEIPEWERQLRANVGKHKKNPLDEGVDYNVVKRWNNGFKMVHYKTKKACKFEGQAVGHCAKSYSPNRLYSLYDEKDMPHATLEVRDGKDVHQIKGKQNAAPVPKYRPFIVDFIKSVKFNVVKEGKNIGMAYWNGKFYFRDTDEFKKLYRDEVLPAQQKAIKRVMDSIQTINENFAYILNYSELLNE